MSDYLKITKKELSALVEISDSMIGMAGAGDRYFDIEAKKGKRAIDSILKRNGLQRKPFVEQNITVENIR